MMIEKIKKYLNDSQVKNWVQSHSNSITDYDKFCDDFVDRIMFPQGRSFESKLMIVRTESSEIRFNLDLGFNYLESHSYRNLGGRVLTKRCPVSFPN